MFSRASAGTFAPLILLLAVLSACDSRRAVPLRHEGPQEYSSARIEGRIVDGPSRQPVPGAVVVAIWRRVERFTERWDGVFRMVETITDREGRFRVERWGPRPAIPFDDLDARDPELWVLKDGYLLTFLDNRGRREPLVPLADPNNPTGPRTLGELRLATLPPNKVAHTHGELRRSATGKCIWDGRDIELQRPSDDIQYAQSLSAANPLDPWLPQDWRALPMFQTEWAKAREHLPARLQAVVVHPESPIDLLVKSHGAL